MKARLHQTEPPNALPASERCPGQPRRRVGGSFTLPTQFAFGHGGDHPSYVSAKYSCICPVGNAGMELVALGLSPKISRPTELDHISQGERFFWATDLWRAWEATPRLHPALNFLFIPWSRQKQLPKSSPAAHRNSNRLPNVSKALPLPTAAAGTAALRKIEN